MSNFRFMRRERNDGIAELLRELSERDKEIAKLRTRVRQLTKSRDKWREKALVTPPGRRAYRREWMAEKRAA